MSTRTEAITTAPAGADSVTVIPGYGLAIAKALEYSGVDSRRVCADQAVLVYCLANPAEVHREHPQIETARRPTTPRVL